MNQSTIAARIRQFRADIETEPATRFHRLSELIEPDDQSPMAIGIRRRIAEIDDEPLLPRQVYRLQEIIEELKSVFPSWADWNPWDSFGAASSSNATVSIIEEVGTVRLLSNSFPKRSDVTCPKYQLDGAPKF